MDITGPYLSTPRGNKYLLTFTDHFTKYTEAFPIADQTAETCARVYVTQIVSRHGTGAQLIMDQGRAFMSSFFKRHVKCYGYAGRVLQAITPLKMGRQNGGTKIFILDSHTT